MHEYLNQQQRKAVEALRLLKNVCDNEGIQFFLLAGSTLGAVRHHGMIPWDDDIDVGFLRDDWYKIRNILPEAVKDTEFTYSDDEADKGFPRLFGKILCDNRGCVDIFLIARWTENRIDGNIHWQIRRIADECYRWSLNYRYVSDEEKKLKGYRKIKHNCFRFIRKTIYCITKPFCSTESYKKLARWNERYYEGRDTGCYINLYSIYSMEKECIKATWIENTSTVDFEGDNYLTVGDTHAYLTHLYGNYMTPPPQKEHYGKHDETF